MITDRKHVNAANLRAEMEQIAGRLRLDDAKEALYFPKYFQVETVRLCNAHCPFCAIDQWDKSVPLIDDILFEKVATELSEYADWIEVVNLSRAGEPLMDRKIAQRVKRVKEAGIKTVTLSTNASLLTKKKSVELLEAGIDDIMLSIDSIDKEPYEKMRVGLNYEKVMRNVEVFFRIREEINPKVIVRVRGVSYYDLEKDEDRSELRRWEGFWDRFRKPQDRIYMKQLHSWGNQIDVVKRTEGVADGQYGDIYHPCILPWSTMHISAMGIVALCPQDYDAKMNLGDINRESIVDVWRNNKWAWVRDVHSTGERNQIELCRGCKIFDLDFSLEKKPDRKELYEG